MLITMIIVLESDTLSKVNYFITINENISNDWDEN